MPCHGAQRTVERRVENALGDLFHLGLGVVEVVGDELAGWHRPLQGLDERLEAQVEPVLG